MFTLVLLVHLMLCVMLILLVLLQQGKGADAGALMGSGADSILGAGSAGSLVSRVTTGAAIAFMLTSILLVKLYAAAPTAPQQVDVLQGSTVTEPEAASAPAGTEKAEEPAAPAPQAPAEKAGEAPQLPAQNQAPAPDVAGK